MPRHKVCEGCGCDMRRKWAGASHGKKVLCMSCNSAGVRFTATGEVRKPETEEEIFKRNIPIAEKIAARLLREERERKWEFMTFAKEDTVRLVHIDQPGEPEMRVHIMVGADEQSLNLTECGRDAGLNPREVTPNSTTAGDLCIGCCEGFAYEARQSGFPVV